jgi:hypothetical protein
MQCVERALAAPKRRSARARGRAQNSAAAFAERVRKPRIDAIDTPSTAAYGAGRGKCSSQALRILKREQQLFPDSPSIEFPRASVISSYTGRHIEAQLRDTGL